MQDSTSDPSVQAAEAFQERFDTISAEQPLTLRELLDELHQFGVPVEDAQRILLEAYDMGGGNLPRLP